MVCPECGKKLPDNAVKCNKCGKMFKKVIKSSETDEFLKKEKEKSEERAKKLKEKNDKKLSANPERKSKVKKTLKIVVPVIALLLIAGIIAGVAISKKQKEKEEYMKANFPEKLMEYTFKEVSDEDAVMKLGDINIGAEEYEFFYRQSFSNVQNSALLQFKQYMGEKLGEEYSDSEDYYEKYYDEYSKGKHNLFDFTKPVNGQQEDAVDANGNTISWQEYIREDAVKTMSAYHVKYDLAKKDGAKLTDDIKYQVYTHIEGLRDAVTGGGYQSLNQYLKILFGKGCDENFFKDELIREYTASKYDTVSNIRKIDSYSKEEIDKIYKESNGNYDYIDLSVYEVTGKDAEKTAKKLAGEIKTLDDFTGVVQKYAGSAADKTYMPMVPKQYISQQYSEKLGQWAYGSERKINDKDAFKTNKGYAVAIIEKPVYTTENAVSYREIVINKNSESTANTAAESTPVGAKEQAEQIYEEWKQEKPSEDTFAYFAMKNSAGSNAANGGLVPCASENDISENLKKWLTDKSRKQGDTALIDTDGSYTIVYFLKNYGSYRNYAIRADKAGEDVVSDFDKIMKDSYAQSFDADLLQQQEEKIITAMNMDFFGMGA